MYGITSDVVVGLQYGDEGKGKVVDALIKEGEYELCARFNGGPNAGHTVWVGTTEMATHQVPSGALTGHKSFINANCMVDPIKLAEEMAYIRTKLPYSDIYNLVIVDENAFIITAEHIVEDKAKDKIGSTGCGMTPAYRAKFGGVGLKVKDVMQNDTLLELYPIFRKIRVTDMYQYVEMVRSFKNVSILFEGAQGFNLDINSPNYPYVTKTHCSTAYAFTTGVSLKSLRRVIGVAKIYVTYVGNKDFMPDDDDLRRLQELGYEFGVTTGRPRQCNWLNLDELKESCDVNGVDELIINKCDIIQALGKYKLYEDGELKTFSTWDEMRDHIKKSLSMSVVRFSYSPHEI